MRLHLQPSDINRLLAARGLRAFADGFGAVLLPAYLLALGLGGWETGVLSSATLLGSAAMTVSLGMWGHRVQHRRLLQAAALLMLLTGLGFAAATHYWPLLLVALVGTLNPGSGDASVFAPLEHARLAHAAEGEARTTLFARYTLLGTFSSALGALASGLPQVMTDGGVAALTALRAMFVVYGAIGVAIWLIYRGLSAPDTVDAPPAPLGPSRGIVVRLAALFSIDAFAGGLLVQSLLALWLFRRFDMGLAEAGAFFFWATLLTGFSQLVAPALARRIGLLNTMVFTHIPASLALIAAALATRLDVALALLLVRAALSQMDVPTRSAYVMSVVTPAERAAAASFTVVPRSLASALGPSMGGALFASGLMAAPLLMCGVLKIGYDLALWAAFRRQRVG